MWGGGGGGGGGSGGDGGVGADDIQLLLGFLELDWSIIVYFSVFR